jgi:hypothetical protein
MSIFERDAENPPNQGKRKRFGNVCHEIPGVARVNRFDQPDRLCRDPWFQPVHYARREPGVHESPYPEVTGRVDAQQHFSDSGGPARSLRIGRHQIATTGNERFGIA